MQKSCYIYCVTNKINGLKYIGATTRDVEKRWGQHISDAKTNRNNGCTSIKNAIQEYGEKSFEVQTLIICNTQYIDSYEDKFIKLYNTLSPNGYNLKTGGNFGSKHIEETKTKIGDAHKGKIISKETRILTGKTSKYRNMSEENEKRIKNALDILNLKDLPIYIYYSIDKRNNRNVEVINVRIPNKQNKKFAIKDMSLHEKIKLAIEYKNFLTTTVIGSSDEELKV